MHLKSFVVRNFRRLKNVQVDLSNETTIFVGANNSGKTSATHIFQLFLGDGGRFSIYDFSADCWDEFNKFDPQAEQSAGMPIISLDLWFDVDENNLHCVIDLLPDLDWQDKPVGVRLSFEPRDEAALYANYLEACEAAASKIEVNGDDEGRAAIYKPWPTSLYDYLSKRLNLEYQVSYYKLDIDQFDDKMVSIGEYQPPELDGGAKVVDSIIRVDFLDAQRYLSDAESRGRTEDLSKRLSRFYMRNLQKRSPDIEALRAITESENRLNKHFADVFEPTIDTLGKLDYPGLANPKLVIRTDLKADSLLNGSAQVHYAVAGVVPDIESSLSITLPDRYNGLGFKNLIYMAVEILDFHNAWMESEESRPPVHLVVIEEPESHLHAQLQQVFIRQIKNIVGEAVDGVGTQFVVTTHSSHIVYEDFRFIRYFCRLEYDGGYHYTNVKNLSLFYSSEEAATRDFLIQYLKLTHCDLFFADAAILVEGNVERILLPLIINKACRQLEACRLTILEVGGAHAHKFRQLIEFLGLTCLVITDIDSVGPAPVNEKDEGEDGDVGVKEVVLPESEADPAPKTKKFRSCLTNVPGAVTANPTLRQWVPVLSSIGELLDLGPKLKVHGSGAPFTATVRVAYQVKETVVWRGEIAEEAGRTFEEAFAFQNLEWTQEVANSSLHLQVKAEVAAGGLESVMNAIFKKVRGLDKTAFALALINGDSSWVPPTYIVEGLKWLADHLGLPDESPTPALVEVGK